MRLGTRKVAVCETDLQILGRVNLVIGSGSVHLRQTVARMVLEEQNRAESLLDLRR